jgi:hypothetical protein
MRDERTLTERLERVENILSLSGFGGDEYSACDRAVTGQRHVSEDKLERHIERAGNTAAPGPTSFEEIVNRIQTSTDRICMIASKLEEIGNRVFGPVPEEAAGLGAERKPDGMLDHTFISLNYLDMALCRLHTAAARLERI